MTRNAIGWVVGVVATVALLGMFVLRPVAAQQAGGGAAPASGSKYTVVDTEGTNLLVVDNSTNTVYFYTVEPGKEVGDDLHLRGSLDLNKVGEKMLTPKKAEK